MSVSKYAIVDLISYLETTPIGKGESDGKTVYIESYVNDLNENRIRLSTETYVSCELSTYNKSKGDILDENIEVNLYDLFNIVKCSDDIINFEIDGDNLLISSYYSVLDEYDQMEMSIPIESRWDVLIDEVEIPQLSLGKITLDMMSKHQIINHIDISEDIKDLYLVNKNGKFSLVSANVGFSIAFQLKGFSTNTYSDFSVKTSAHLLRLLFTTGVPKDNELVITPTELYIDIGDYKFRIPLESTDSPFTVDYNSEKMEDSRYFVLENEAWVTLTTLLSRLDMSNKTSTVKVDYVDTHHADFTIKQDGRYEGSMRISGAMLKDESIEFDVRLFHLLTKDLNNDAITMHKIGDDIFMYLEDGAMVKQIQYNHTEYTKKPLMKWKL